MKTTFYSRVYSLASKIPAGKVTTYKEIARALHSKAYRAVGSAMNKNPYSIKGKNKIYVACHRVINSDGCIGGFASGVKNKIRLLSKEGVIVKNSKINLKKYFYKFS
jgi:methylated-DNA-[protein]-cysteine S-methyltransferase